MQKISWRFILPFLLLALAACGNLAGDVEIVGTVTPSTQTQRLAFELPSNPPDVANGQLLFQTNCTQCHGTQGAGNGALVESGEVPRMASFLEAAHVRQQSLEFYYDIITNGNLINLMPPWSNSLSLQERWDVAAYVYSLHYSDEQIALGESLVTEASSVISPESDAVLAAETGLEGENAFAAVAYQRVQSFRNWGVEISVPLPDSTEAPVADFEFVSFFGTVTQGTSGFTVPAGLPVQLRYGNEAAGLQILETTLDANNQFRFDNVTFDPNFSYFASVGYQERGFVSELLVGLFLEAENQVDIQLFETSRDPSAITVTRIDFLIENLSVSDVGTGLVIRQRNTYQNFSDRMFILQPEGQEINVSLLMQLPVGANILNDPNNPRFIIAQNEFALIDLQPVYPGTHVIEAIYFLPYENGRTIDIPLNNNFNGEISFALTVPELSIRGAFIGAGEERNLGTEEEAIIQTVYTGSTSLAAGESLIFDIDGQLVQATSADSNIVTQEQLLPLILIVVIIFVLLAIAVFFYMRSQSRGNTNEVERLMAEIRQLEVLHETGRINHDVFQQKRQALKQQLAALMAEQKANE